MRTETILLSFALIGYSIAAYARITSPSASDRDSFCAGAQNAEVCADSSGNFVPTVTNNQSLGTSGLKWSDGYFAGDLSADSLSLTGQSVSGVSTFTAVVVNSSFTLNGGFFGTINGSTWTQLSGTYTDNSSVIPNICVTGSTVTLVTGNNRVRIEWAGGFVENDTTSQASNTSFLIDGAFPDSLAGSAVVMGGGTTSATSEGMRFHAGFTYTTRNRLSAGTHTFCLRA